MPFVVLLLLLVPATLWAQELACPAINFFGPACVRVVPMSSQAVAPGAPVAPAAPLFTRETVAPGTPDVAIKAFNDPTLANVRAWRDWRLKRLDRAQLVQQMLNTLDQQDRQP